MGSSLAGLLVSLSILTAVQPQRRDSAGRLALLGSCVSQDCPQLQRRRSILPWHIQCWMLLKTFTVVAWRGMRAATAGGNHCRRPLGD